eukprot:GFUD01079836.1.p1 GENE.GFUD01079836.1~~GFUD01079836.1.p1  ORF type:complete len:161 (-),score=37.41 GFUD01079836.1:152-634(-)
MTKLMRRLCALLSVMVGWIHAQSGNTRVASENTKFFLTSGSSPDLLSGAAGFGLGLVASQIGGSLINGITNGGSSGGSSNCCCGRRKRQAAGNPNERFFGIGGGNSCSCGRKKRQTGGKDTKLFGLGGSCANCPNCGGNNSGNNGGCRCRWRPSKLIQVS